MVVLNLISMFIVFQQVTASGSCLNIPFLVTVTNQQGLKAKLKLAISQEFVTCLLFEGAANDLQMDHCLQFFSVS